MEEREEEDEPGEKDALAFEEEHERLASKYHSEKVLLEQALKASTSSSSRSCSPDPIRLNIIEEDTKNEIPESSQSNDNKNSEFKKFLPLEPIIAAPSKKPRVKNLRISEGSPTKLMVIHFFFHKFKNNLLEIIFLEKSNRSKKLGIVLSSPSKYSKNPLFFSVEKTLTKQFHIFNETFTLNFFFFFFNELKILYYCCRLVFLSFNCLTSSLQDESPEDMKKREEYLKARRDKLVALKKQARSQRLEMTKARPGSAKIAAEASIRGMQNYEASQIPEPSIIQVRKALAARLKAEVVGP